MDFVTKRATRYRTMAAQGVTAGNLRYLNRWNGRVMVNFRHASNLSKEQAKRLATDYLVSEFEAYDISFVVVPDAPYGVFAAKFTSDAL